MVRNIKPEDLPKESLVYPFFWKDKEGVLIRHLSGYQSHLSLARRVLTRITRNYDRLISNRFLVASMSYRETLGLGWSVRVETPKYGGLRQERVL